MTTQTELSREEIAMVFAMYLGAEIKYAEHEETSTLESVSVSGLLGDENRDESGEGWYDTADCKLLLTPLSEITDEDAIEVAKLHNISTDNLLKMGQALVYWLDKEGKSRD